MARESVLGLLADGEITLEQVREAAAGANLTEKAVRGGRLIASA